jgi:hypothetical protein
MDHQEITTEDLERFATAMADAIPDLDCPDCCEQGWKYQYVEMSAAIYRDQWEWHCLLSAILRHRRARGTSIR